MTEVIDPKRFGVSFSMKQCWGLGVDPANTLNWLLQEAGFRRFRLMSYWDEHEKQPGKYDFSRLDAQIEQISKAGGVITLCLGARQPRWPENHWPQWAWKASKAERTDALLRYIETVVKRYRANPAIISYQLENEALLKSFGRRPEVDRQRLRKEFQLVKQLDPTRPIIMSTSTSWGMPLRQPIPDIVGFSYYHVYWNKRTQSYHKAGGHYVFLHRLRSLLIKLLLGKPSFVHELQLEPWGPTGIDKMTFEEQDKSMGSDQIEHSISLAKRTKLYPIDLWGGEWWYWRHIHGDDSTWHNVEQMIG